MKKHWKTILLWIGICETVGILSGLLSMKGMKSYQQTAIQPFFAPPPLLFPIVWTVLFVLMGIGIARIRRNSNVAEKYGAQNLFIAQLVVNFFWPLIFFNARAFGPAFFWLILLWVMVLCTVLLFWKQDKLAAFLQIPYWLWTTFACILNFAVWQLN